VPTDIRSIWENGDSEVLLYVSKLLDIESRESANGEYKRWSWEILEGPHTGQKVYANSSTNFGPQAKARQWVENVLGRELEAGEQIGVDDLVGGKHHLMVENVKRTGAPSTTCRRCISTGNRNRLAGPLAKRPRL
jgi:hypothetical protein